MKVLISVFGAIITLVIVFFLGVAVFMNTLDLQPGLDVIATGISTLLFSLLISYFFRKTKIYSKSILVLSIITCSFLIFKASIKYKMVNEVKPVIEWSNTNHKQTIPFFVTKTGHIFLKTNINSEENYMMFDTGMDITALHEKFNGFKAIDTLNITSSQARKQDVAIHKLDSLSLGALSLKKLGYGAMSRKAWENCGIFANKDSIIGLLGNNVINNFVWDFDMINQEITIQENPFINDSIPNKKVIPLRRKGMGWIVDVKLNGKKKRVKLDSGSNSILNLTDSIQLAKTYAYFIKKSQSKGVFSYLDCSGKEGVKAGSNVSKNHQKRSVFVNLEIGETLYKDAYVIDKSTSNLLGVPLFWEYERVVLDFISKKMHLINPVQKSNSHQISIKSKVELQMTKYNAIKQAGYYEMHYKKPVVIKTKSKASQDTLIFNFKGKTRIFASIDMNYSTKEIKVVVDSILGKGFVLNTKTGKSTKHNKKIQLSLNENTPLNEKDMTNKL
ncbi:hypothetical protein [Algibacter sp. 2305UL17-15]|uniref:hypothetical protein n=1 Tax=Algibacter sp. 2305UL17-15 TaxID=3231268 RepID=UPI00345AD433